MAGGDIWVQWFTCCVTQQPPPVSEILFGTYFFLAIFNDNISIFIAVT
jgi:hypothetical protein